jgi:CheY-like chemotaxis protein
LQTIKGNPIVLVVEDNPDNMLTVKAILADNYTIIEAVNGNEAVELAKKHTLNLILMDIALPEMDGIEAFKAIREIESLNNIPIIALTASAMTTDREAILAHGFDAYIAKPIDENIFFNTINELLYGK